MGKQYNRAIKAHKMMYEALKRLHWEEFVKWLNTNDYSCRLDCLNASTAELVSEIENVRNACEVDQPRFQEKLKVGPAR